MQAVCWYIPIVGSMKEQATVEKHLKKRTKPFNRMTPVLKGSFCLPHPVACHPIFMVSFEFKDDEYNDNQL
jgi:hypothetical protein